MKRIILLPILFIQTLASPHIRKRDICIVEPLNDPLVDDVPNIAAALQKCGNTGRVVLPVNETFHLRSPLDLSSCKACDFQINGVLKISPDWDYWEKQSAAIKISKMRAAIIRSDGDTGIIDASRFGWATDGAVSVHIPKLFSISDASDHIVISNLKIQNVAGTAFYVHSNSSAIQFNYLEFKNPASTAYLFEQTQHVYIWSNTIRADSACVSIAANASNIQVQQSTCYAQARGDNPTPSGIELKFPEREGGVVGADWIKNIFVKTFKAMGNMNVIAFLAGTGNSGVNRTVEITNATFSDVSFEGPVRRAVLLQQDDSILRASDVSFREFGGEAEEKSALVCVHPEDECGFKTEGDWANIK